MNKKTLLAAAPLFLAASISEAAIIDFVQMTEAGAFGESAWTTLNVATTDFNLDISASKLGDPAFAYLDWGHAGLGVCGNAGNSNGSPNTLRPGTRTNICNPGSDDNVTFGESLRFVFDTDVVIDRIWFNNTHDPDRTIINPDRITIDGANPLAVGNGYAPTSNHYNTSANYNSSVDNWLGSFNVAAGHAFDIAYNNEQFYISGMEVHSVTVPEPGVAALLGGGLLLLGTRARRARA